MYYVELCIEYLLFHFFFYKIHIGIHRLKAQTCDEIIK